MRSLLAIFLMTGSTPLSRPGPLRVVRGPDGVVGMDVQALSNRGWVDSWSDSALSYW